MHVVLAAAIIGVFGLAAYGNSLGGPLVLDDTDAIARNTTIRRIWPPTWLFPPPGTGVGHRPLANLSLAFNYACGGDNVRGYHVLNLLLHFGSALTLFGIIHRTLERMRIPRPPRSRQPPPAVQLATAATLLWTLHPVHPATVTYLSQRTELLMALCYLLTVYAFIRSTAPGAGRFWSAFSVATCAAGMAAKEVMVTAPVLVLLYDRHFIAGSFAASWQRRRPYYLMLAATWLVLALLLRDGLAPKGAGFGLGVTWLQYGLTECGALLRYLGLAVWPHPLVFDYGPVFASLTVDAVAAAVVILLLLAMTIVRQRHASAVGFAAAAFFLILAPTSSIVPIAQQPIAENRLYLPLAVLAATAVIALHRAIGSRALTAVALAAPMFGALTFDRNVLFQDEIMLWADTAAKRPQNPRALASYALALAESGRPREAIAPFERALQLDPQSFATLQNLGNARFQLGEFAAATTCYQRAVTLQPRLASAHNNLGAAQLETGDTTAALASFSLALALEPDHTGAHLNAGRALLAARRFAEAAVHYRALTRITPTSPEAHYNLGVALAGAGTVNGTEAASALQRALTLRPDFPAARHELARLRPTP